jgi:hypothetical protein
VKKWVEAYKAKRAGDRARTCKILKELMAGFVGCTDMPPLDFIPELMDVYPDAKVVLVTRDPEKWLESIRPVAKNASLWWLQYAMFLVPGWRWFPSLSLEFGTSTREILEDGGQAANPKPSTGESTRGWQMYSLLIHMLFFFFFSFPDLLRKWNAKVKQMVPPEKLLEMDLKDGWEPLCTFLNVPVPNEPLPRANDAAAAEKVADDITNKLIQIWVGIGVSVTAVVAIEAFTLLKRR